MTWINPPQSVVDFRDALINCATVSGTVLNGLTLLQMQARFHYPGADVRTDPLPAFVLSRPKFRVEKSEYGGTQGKGNVGARMFVSDASGDDGTVEQWADGIALDLPALTTADTLYVTAAEVGECVEASPGMLAASVTGQPDEQGATYRVISIDAEWEG